MADGDYVTFRFYDDGNSNYTSPLFLKRNQWNVAGVGINTESPASMFAVNGAVTLMGASGSLTFPEISAPTTPSTGNVVVYAKTDGKMYKKDDTGTESEIGSGGGITTNVQSSNFTCITSQRYIISANDIVATLPASPTLGDTIEFLAANTSTANLTIGRNGKNIMGLAEDMNVSTSNFTFSLVYFNTNNDWRLAT